MMTKKTIKNFSDYFEIDFLKKFERKSHHKDKNKDLIIADAHTPFHDKPSYEKAISNTDCNDLYILGDWFDFFSRSHYRKSKEISFNYEFREGYRLLREAARNFNCVYLLMSNHDERYRKYIYDNVPVELLNFVNDTFVEDLLKTIPNLKILRHRVSSGRKIGYVYQEKTCVFTHVELSRKQITNSVQQIWIELARQKNFYNMRDFNMIIQAHNHQSGKIRLDENLWMFQIPCLADTNQVAFDYVFSGKLQGNVPVKGYLVAVRDNGFINPKKSYIIDL